MIPLRRRLYGTLEVLIGIGLLAGFAPAKFLLNINPSPFFLLVIYGAWVAGTLVGVLSGLLCSIVYLLMLTAMTSFPLDAFWAFFIADPSHYLTPAFLLIAGYVFGELRMSWERRMHRLNDQAQISHQEAADARARLQQAETALLELQGRVLGQTATMRRLYGIAQSLNVLSVDKILLELMGVLEDLLQVEQASIYRVEESNRFARLAVRKGGMSWPNSLAVADHELVAKAIGTGKIYSFVAAEEGDVTAPIYLVPILQQGRTHALIAIHRLPLAKVTADTQELLGILAKWAGSSLERATAYESARRVQATFPNSRVLRYPFFQELCALEKQRYQRYQIPYTVMVFQLYTELGDAQVPELLTERLEGGIRAFDSVTWEPESGRVVLLLPTLEADDSDRAQQRILARLDGGPLGVQEPEVFNNCSHELAERFEEVTS
jgi:K+-sensing histidine kinase KdpD